MPPNHTGTRPDLGRGFKPESSIVRPRLSVEMLPRTEALSQDIDEMAADLAEMESMISAYLAFARGEAAEQTELVNLVSLLDDVATGPRRSGKTVTLSAPPELSLSLRAGAVRRASVFRPFESDTDGGTGLGLTIARDIARAQRAISCWATVRWAACVHKSGCRCMLSRTWFRGNNVPRGESDDRLIGIELLRFAAAFAVLIWHYQNFLIGGPDHPALIREAQPFDILLAPFYTYGNSGVELFWCISGFIFTWKYLRPIHNRDVSFGRFIWLRFSRLYPLHFATLLAVAALNGIYFARHGTDFMDYIYDIKHFILNLGFASYWGFQNGNSFNGPIWSVSVEILVYFLFFGISLMWRGTVWSDIGIVLLASACYAGLRHAGIKLEVFGATTFFYIGAATCRVDALLAGLRPDVRRAATAGLLGIVLLSWILTGAHVLKIAGASLVMFPAAILLAQQTIQPRSLRWRSAIGAVGNLTYASYLIHYPLQIAIVLLLETTSATASDLFYGPWLLPAYLILVLGLSVPVFHGFERPVQLWLRNFGRQRVLVS